MSLLWSLGQAVTGLFLAVLLAGLLAGTVAYGVIEQWLRRGIQRRVVGDMLAMDPDAPRSRGRGIVNYAVLAQWMLRNSPDLFSTPPRATPDPAAGTDSAPVGGVAGQVTIDSAGAAPAVPAVVQTSAPPDLPELLDIDPDDFYALHYRQLCGQLAARVSSEAAAAAADKSHVDSAAAVAAPPPGEVTSLLAARMRASPTAAAADPAFRRAAERALAFIDRLQLRLADAVVQGAFRVALAVVVLIFIGLLLPVARALALFPSNPSLILQSLGMFLSVILAVLILAILAFGALIVANLAFRWIDRVASPR